MSKADILSLVATLSNGIADTAIAERYYDDVIFELARENWFVDASVIPLTRGLLEVDLDAAVAPSLINTLGIIYDDRELEETPKVLMESIDPYWRDRIGSPRSYITEDENAKVIALHPSPWVAGSPELDMMGEPLGQDYPIANLLCFYSYAAEDPWQPPPYLSLTIALRILALEFNRESDHTDMEYAQAAQALSDMFKGLLA